MKPDYTEIFLRSIIHIQERREECAEDPSNYDTGVRFGLTQAINIMRLHERMAWDEDIPLGDTDVQD